MQSSSVYQTSGTQAILPPGFHSHPRWATARKTTRQGCRLLGEAAWFQHIIAHANQRPFGATLSPEDWSRLTQYPRHLLVRRIARLVEEGLATWDQATGAFDWVDLRPRQEGE